MYHPALGQVRYSVREVRNGTPDEQVVDTVAIMREYSIQDAQDGSVQADAAQASGTGDPISDTWAHLRRGGNRGMRFVRDEVTFEPFTPIEMQTPGRWTPIVESIARPELLAKSEDPHGDCDCFCTYAASHLILKGVPCSFVTVAADGDTPDLYTHVYLAAYPQSGPYAGQRVALDLSHGPYPGWEVQRTFRKKEWPVQSAGGLGSMACVASLALGIATLWVAMRGGL